MAARKAGKGAAGGISPATPAPTAKPKGKRAAAKKSSKKRAATKKSSTVSLKANQVIGNKVLRLMTFHGVVFEKGSVFVAAEVGCSAYRLQQLIKARRVSHEPTLGKAANLKNLCPANQSARSVIAKAFGEEKADKVVPRVRLVSV